MNEDFSKLIEEIIKDEPIDSTPIIEITDKIYPNNPEYSVELLNKTMEILFKINDEMPNMFSGSRRKYKSIVAGALYLANLTMVPMKPESFKTTENFNEVIRRLKERICRYEVEIADLRQRIIDMIIKRDESSMTKRDERIYLGQKKVGELFGLDFQTVQKYYKKIDDKFNLVPEESPILKRREAWIIKQETIKGVRKDIYENLIRLKGVDWFDEDKFKKVFKDIFDKYDLSYLDIEWDLLNKLVKDEKLLESWKRDRWGLRIKVYKYLEEKEENDVEI